MKNKFRVSKGDTVVLTLHALMYIELKIEKQVSFAEKHSLQRSLKAEG